MSEENIDLGHKRTCPCGSVKYYDFYQDELDCPECGKSIEPINISRPKRGRKAGVTIATTPTKTVKENDELKDLIDETVIAQHHQMKMIMTTLLKISV